MSKSRVLGSMGTENYKMSDCPFHLPKSNIKAFHDMQSAASNDPYANMSQYGNAYSPSWHKQKKQIYESIMRSVAIQVKKALNDL